MGRLISWTAWIVAAACWFPAGLEAGMQAGAISRVPHFQKEEEVSAVEGLLADGRIAWVREDIRLPSRNPEAFARMVDRLTRLRAQGVRVLGIVPWSMAMKPDGKKGFPDVPDLAAVYRQAMELRRAADGAVDVWELGNEPDLAFLPLSPDQAAAVVRAAVLGLRDGLPEKPPAMIPPSLALPPGAWALRAARNGWFDFWPTINFHFYGNPDEFPGVLREQERFQRAFAPGMSGIWLTETGFERKPPDGPGAERAEEEQARYIKDMVGLAEGRGVDVFFPYAMSDRSMPGYSMLTPGLSPLPSWKEYAAWSVHQPRLIGPPPASSPLPPRLILQWRPVPAMFRPHKVSGSYRWQEKPVPGEKLGEIRVWNFGTKEVLADLKGNLPRGVCMTGLEKGGLRVPAGGYADAELEAQELPDGYLRLPLSFRVETEEGAVRLGFALESIPSSGVMDARPLPLACPAPESVEWIGDSKERPAFTAAGPWRCSGAIRVEGVADGWQVRTGGGEDKALSFLITEVDGLPSHGFLRLTCRDMGSGIWPVRVDLVDARGQRFTVFENLGRGGGAAPGEAWLNLADFSPYFWGTNRSGPLLRPGLVRQIQLRFHPPSAQDAAMEFSLGFFQPSRAGGWGQ